MSINTEILPAHARLVAEDDVWMEGSALDQLARVAALPACRRAVGMPDLHAGPGIPIGAAFDFAGVIRPLLVGGDAGCGARVVVLPRIKASGDTLERRVRQELDARTPDLGADPIALLRAVWAEGPRGLLRVDGVPDTLAELAEAEVPDTEDVESSPLGDDDAAACADALGSIGGGNHFLELSRVSAVADKTACAAAGGLKAGGYAVVAHSGSRGLGRALVGRWGDVVLEDAASQDRYRAELAGAVRFARANRLVLAWRMLAAVGMARPGKLSGWFDVTHNTVVPSAEGGWLHRKGSAPAEAGQPTVVLGSRGTESWVMLGCGEAGCLCSVAHGAGRRMGRTEAAAKIKARYPRRALERTPLGGRVICDDTDLLYEEHPDAYKAIEPVIRSLEVAGAARRVAALAPLITVKR